MIKFKLLELLEKRPEYKGLSYQKIAKKIGVSTGALHQMVHGRKTKNGAYEPYTPSLSTLDRLCKKLGCQPGDLLEYRK